MHLLAVTALEKASQISPATWVKIGIGVAAVIVAFVLLKRLARMNKVVMGVMIFVVVVVVFFSWVYNRNEPRFLTPVVEKIAPFFPSAGSYASKQQNAPRP
jgi:MFS superfamily sulfate permease-like transporter